jgi:hypothetical protein
LQFGVETFETGLVEVTSTSNIGRTFDVGYLGAFVQGFQTTIAFDFACNVTLLNPQGTGLSCGGPALAFDLNLDDPGQFDISDDGVFTISIRHNIFLACGIDEVPITFQLTKQ